MTTELEQPTTFEKLMRESSTLFQVAGWAGYNQIARVIRSAASKGNDVIDMVFIAQLLMAVVAPLSLSMQLRLNVFDRMNSRCFLKRMAVTAMYTAYYFATLSMTPFLIIYFCPISVLQVREAALCSFALSMCGFPLPIFLTQFFPMRLTITPLCLVILLFLLFSFLFIAFLAVDINSILIILAKGITRKRQYMLAVKASFMSYWNLFNLPSTYGRLWFFCLSALLTLMSPHIKSALAFTEKLRGCGKEFFAFGALYLRGILGYDVHDKGHSLSGQGRLRRCLTSSYLPPLYHRCASEASLGGTL